MRSQTCVLRPGLPKISNKYPTKPRGHARANVSSNGSGGSSGSSSGAGTHLLCTSAYCPPIIIYKYIEYAWNTTLVRRRTDIKYVCIISHIFVIDRVCALRPTVWRARARACVSRARVQNIQIMKKPREQSAAHIVWRAAYARTSDAVQSMISGGSIIILCLLCTAPLVCAACPAFRLDRSISVGVRGGVLACATRNPRARSGKRAQRDMSMQLCVHGTFGQIIDCIAATGGGNQHTHT